MSTGFEMAYAAGFMTPIIIGIIGLLIWAGLR